MARPDLTPINDEDLGEFAAFLQEQFGSTHSVEEWMAAFSQDWCAHKPNNGYMLREGGRVVGAIGAIYGDRIIRGRTETFCNITAWNVLPQYRMHSMRLATALTSQGNYHFTDFTPTNTVRKSLQFLKFQSIDASQIIIPNLPSYRYWGGSCRILDSVEQLELALSDSAVKVMNDHRHLPWLRQVAIQYAQGIVHVVYKPIRVGHRLCAFILAADDREGLTHCLSSFGTYLLFRQGIYCMRLERRFLTKTPMVHFKYQGAPRKLFLSSTLEQNEIDNLYSELVSLNIRSELL